MLTGEKLRQLIHETNSILQKRHHALCPAFALDSLAPSLTLALVWRPDNAVGSLPRPVVVERCAALAVLASRVVPAHTLAVDLPLESTGRKRTFENTPPWFKVKHAHAGSGLRANRA